MQSHRVPTIVRWTRRWNVGTMGWTCDGQDAGKYGLSLRAEAVDVQMLPKGQVPRGYDGSAACVTR